MPAGSELTSAAIAPGSTEYGQRGNLEAGLASVLGQGGGGAPGGPEGGAPLPPAQNPIESLLGGGIGAANLPITDGLSVGQGAGPVEQADPMLGDRANRLRMIASQAASPQLRALARSELRRMTREPL
jgi:hypothetical protein